MFCFYKFSFKSVYISFLLVFLTLISSAESAETADYKSWVAEMKNSRKGPFKSVLWFCEDGSVLPAKPYACKEHGGGHQHGEPSKKTQILQNKGYHIANFLVDFDAQKSIRTRQFIDWYNQVLIEKFLIRTDNGWILKQAQFYRGAYQEEEERDGARTLLMALVANPEWINYRFQALRIGAQLLPHGQDSASIQKVRQLSIALSEKDKAFKKLRIKIHVSPSAENAQGVRQYAETSKNQKLKADYLALAKEIDKVFQLPPLPELLEKTARRFSGAPWLQKLLRDAKNDYKSNNTANNHFAVSAQLLAKLRDALPKIHQYRARLRILDLSLAVEKVHFKASTQLRSEISNTSREQRIDWLQDAVLAVYGTGHINQRSLQALQLSLNRLLTPQVSLNSYFDELKYLARTPGWVTQSLRFQFYRSVAKLAEIEPLTRLFIQDVLRGSPMLFFSQTLGGLIRDSHQLAGVTHQLFEQKIGASLHALNPGLARGRLYTNVNSDDFSVFDPEGIYLLPETVAELPPVAGIITAGAGNSLSHVQLLARNLGIPNVSIDENSLDQLKSHDGEIIVMAVSAKGLVEVHKDSEQWRQFFKANKQTNIVIHPDLKKLDLSIQEIRNITLLRASDSGRIVGPKAAKLAELKYHYPDKVAKAIAIPFGVFNQMVLQQPYKKTEQTLWQWMEQQYLLMDYFLLDKSQRKLAMESLRATLYKTVLNTKLGHDFRQQLYDSMVKTFGGSRIGVFIRSDTNVEDLPGFTGAGLNLTLFNVVGFEKILQGIKKVWASPFTPRAFAWRQMVMESPQHVYPALLIMQTVANDKSGVMITQDINSDDKGILSIAVNEGVGGAVDGQSAESLRIDTWTGEIRLLATATADLRKVPRSGGGIVKLPVSHSDRVLEDSEIKQLMQFAKALPETFPMIKNDQGKVVSADVEFGFYKGQLQLFQLRPFLQNSSAQSNSYLINMDKALKNTLNQSIDMQEIP